MSDFQTPISPVPMPLTPGQAPSVPLGPLKRYMSTDEAEKVAKDFESVLLHKVMEEMQRTIPDSGLLSSGITKQVKGMFWFYMAQELAESGGMGLWKQIQAQMPQAAPADGAKPNIELSR